MGFICPEEEEELEEIRLLEEKKKMVAERKSNEAEIESLRDQRVSALERKVDDLTKETDTLCTKQKKSAAALLKEENEKINQVMAKVEEVSKKQAAQESQIWKLTAQIRKFEEEKKGLNTKLQVEENKVESIRRDKAATTEKSLQETIEKYQVELATQKEYHTNVLLNAAKEAEAEASAEARANQDKTAIESWREAGEREIIQELEGLRHRLEEAKEREIVLFRELEGLRHRLGEAEEREIVLVQELEGLRQTLSRTEQQAFSTEDRLYGEITALRNTSEAFVHDCWGSVMEAYESKRSLVREYLRQIQDMQETTAAVKRCLNSRLQEAKDTAATAEEIERSVNERSSQGPSGINVLEAQESMESTAKELVKLTEQRGCHNVA